MRTEEEENEQELSERILFSQDRQSLILKNPSPNLCYVMLSTEPGRKIFHAPSMTVDKLTFSMEKSQGINEECEYFCAVGLANCLTDIEEIIQKSHPSKKKAKTIYICKSKVGFKPSNCSHRLDSPTRKKKSRLYLHPPTDLNAHEIQPILEQFQLLYGQATQVDIKKNCLILSFQHEVEIKNHFKIQKIRSSGSDEAIIKYWSITSHLPLLTFQPIQLIQLPTGAQIENIVVQADWIVFSSSTDILFLHLYKPMELFLTLPDIKPQAIFPYANSRVLIFDKKYVHAYQLHQNSNPTHLGTGKTKKIQPFSIAICKNTAIVGGINFSYMLNEPNSQKELHIFEMFTSMNFHNKNFLADRTFEICKKQPNDPILNLTYMSDLNLFFCSCSNSVYVFHLETESLIASVDLSGPISRIYQVQYPINLINCLVKLQQGGMLIRVSFEQYCEIMGTEVGLAQNYGEPIDFSVSRGKKKNIFLTDGEMITKYDNKNSQVLYSCDEGKQIMSIYTTQEALVFVCEGNESLQIFFKEI